MRTLTLSVDGMTCGGCVDTVSKALKAVGGVQDATVSLNPGAAKIEFDERVTSPDALRAVVRQAGYGVDVVVGTTPAKRGCCG